MNLTNMKRILSAINSNKEVRLRTLAGDTAWRKQKALDPLKVLGFGFTHENIRARQIALFATAKELEQEGLLEVFYQRGENYFRKLDWEPEFPEQYFQVVIQ